MSYWLTTNEARRLITENAWERREGETCGHPGCEDHPRTRAVIHTTLGGFGADWDLRAALDALDSAQTIEWSWSLMGHDLLVVTDEDKHLRFGVRMPEQMRTEQIAAARAG